MQTSAFKLALLMSSSAVAQNPNTGTEPGTNPPAPQPTISDSAPGASVPMPPSRLNVVPPVSPDRNIAEAVGSAPDSARTGAVASVVTDADLAKGAVVNDPSGQPVGTIDSMTDTGVVLTVGDRRVQLPQSSFGKNEKGLVIGLTRAEVEAAANDAAKN